MEVPQKTKLPYDPVIPFPGIYLEKTIIRKDTCIAMLTAALQGPWPGNTPKWPGNTPKCPSTDGWIKRKTGAYMQRNITQPAKEGNDALCSYGDRPRDDHTKQRTSERERQIPYGITYMWNVNYDTNQHIYETKRDSQTHRTALRLPWWGWLGGDGLGVWDSQRQSIIHKMSKQWDSTGNYIHYPVISHNEEEYTYIHTHTHIFAVQKKS